MLERAVVDRVAGLVVAGRVVELSTMWLHVRLRAMPSSFLLYAAMSVSAALRAVVARDDEKSGCFSSARLRVVALGLAGASFEVGGVALALVCVVF